MGNRSVAIVGANGKLGPKILQAMISAQTFDITVLSRASSASEYGSAVNLQRISDEFPEAELIRALHGKDALVVVFSGSNSELQIRLADAAAAAGVRTFIPADFGSCDSSSRLALDLVPLYVEKKKVREHLQYLSTRSKMSWTSIVCGHFFDYGLDSGLLAFDIRKRKALIFDKGDARWSSTTLDTIALAVVRTLQREEETRNRMLYIESFCTTQNEVLVVLENITQCKWKVEHIDSHRYIKDIQISLESGADSPEALENLVSVVGIIDADWEPKADFANDLLDLKKEDMYSIISRVLNDI